MKVGMGQPDQQLLTDTEQVWRVVQGRKNQFYVSVAICTYSLSKSTKEVFNMQWNMAFSKRITHCSQRSVFPYYNLTTLDQEGSPYPPPGELLSRFIDLRRGNFHQYPENQLGILYFSLSTLYLKLNTCICIL